MSTLNRDVRFRFTAINQLDSSEAKLKAILQVIKEQNVAIRATTSAYANQANAATSALNRLATGQKNLSQAMNQTTGAIQSGSRAVAGELERTNKSMSGIVTNLRDLRTIIGASLSLMAVKDFTMDVIEAKSQIDFFKTGLQQMLQSKRDVNILYPEIIQLAKTTPFQVKDLFDTTLALKAMGVQTSQLIPTITQLGNAAAVAGTDKLPLIAKAYTDVMNKGKLMKQEINQFAENGIPLYDLLADSMKKTRDQVIDMAEKHTISFDHIKEAFKVASSEGGRYYNMMILQSQTLAGKVSNLEDTFFVAKATVGDYYEETLKSGIAWTQRLIETTLGSASAIQRTALYIKSLSTLLVGYIVATKASSAITAISSAAMSVKNYILGLQLIRLQATTGAHMVYTLAETRAIASTLAFNAAIRANPIGLIIGIITTAASALMAFYAATKEVVNALGESELKIVQEKRSLDSLAASAMNAAMGSKERAVAMTRLAQEYPEYFRGLDLEKTSNNQLRSILDQVNNSYEKRIALARQAYMVERLEGQRAEALKKEADLMARLKGEIPDSVLQASGGSSDALLKLFNSQNVMGAHSSVGWNPFGSSAKQLVSEVAKELKELDALLEESKSKMEGFRANEIKSAVSAENARWNVVGTQLAKNNQAYTIEYEAHLKKLREIQGREEAISYKSFVDGAEKKKAAVTVSSREIEYIFDEHHSKKLNSFEKHTWDLARIQAAAAVKEAKSEEEAKAKILNIALATEALIKKAYAKRLEAIVSSNAIVVDNEAMSASLKKHIYDQDAGNRKAAEKKKVEAAKDFFDEIKKLSDEKNELDKQGLEVSNLVHEIETASQYKRATIIREIGRRIKDDVTKLEMERIRELRDSLLTQQIMEAQTGGEKTENYRKITKELLEADVKLAKLRKTMNEEELRKWIEQENYRKEYLQNTLNTMAGLFNNTLAIMDRSGKGYLNNLGSDVLEAYDQMKAIKEAADQGFIKKDEGLRRMIVAGVQGAAKMTVSIYSNAQQSRIDMMQKELEEFQTQKEKEMDILEKWTAKEKALLENARDQKIDAAEKALSAQIKALDDFLGLAKTEYDNELANAKARRLDDLNFQEANYKADLDRITGVLDAAKDAHQEELDFYKAVRDKAIDAAEQEHDLKLDRIKEAKDAAIDATKEEYEEKLRLAELFSEDSQIMSNIDDAFRQDFAQRWKDRRLQELADERIRLLVLAKNAEQQANVENYYAKMVAQVHKDYEDGKLDSSISTKLAQEQIAFEGKETSIRLKKEEAERIDSIERQSAADTKSLKEELANQKQQIETNYMNSQLASQAILAAATAQYNADDLEMKIRYASFKGQIETEFRNKEIALIARMNEANVKYEAETAALKQDFADLKLSIESGYAAQIEKIVTQLSATQEANTRELAEKERQIKQDQAHAELQIKKAQLWMNYVMAVSQLVAINPLLGLAAGIILLPVFKTLENRMEAAYNGAFAAIDGPNLDTKRYEQQQTANNQTGNGGIAQPGDTVDLGSYANITESSTEDSAEFQAWKAGQTFAPTSGQAGQDGRETAIGWLKDGSGNPLMNRYTKQFILVYEWLREGNVLKPRTERKFHDGTDFVQRLVWNSQLNPDEVPATLQVGERVLDRDKNRRLKGVDNARLVDDFESFQRLKLLIPGLAELNYSQLKSSSLGSQRSDIERIVDALGKVNTTMANKSAVNLTVDPYKVTVDEVRYNRKMKYRDMYQKSL